MKQKCSALSPLLPDSVFALYCESSLCGVQQRPVTGLNPTPPPPPHPFCSAPRTGSYPPNTVMLRRTMTGPLDPQEMNPIDEPSRSAGQQVSASPPLQGEQGVLGQHAPSPVPPPCLRISDDEDGVLLRKRGSRLGVHRGAGAARTGTRKVLHLAAPDASLLGSRKLKRKERWQEVKLSQTV